VRNQSVFKNILSRRFFKNHLLTLTLLILFPTAALSHPLFVERYNSDSFDTEYLWLRSDSVYAPAGFFPVTTSYASDYINRSRKQINGDYGRYLIQQYSLSFGHTPLNYQTQSRRFTGWLFGDILHMHSFSNYLFREGDHLFTLHDSTRVIEYGLDFIQRFDIIQDPRFKDHAFITYSWGVESWMNYGPHWGAYVRFMDTTERGAGNHTTIYSPYSGYIAGRGTSISYDETEAYLGYQNKNIAVRVGRGKHSWGPSHWNHLLFGYLYAPYPYIELQVNLGDYIRFISFHGELNPGKSLRDTVYVTPEGNVRRVYRDKYIGAHRLEITPTDWISIGLNEAVVYGERPIQIGYVLPFNLYWSEGHQQNWDDNIIWDADIRIKPMRNVLFYAEFLLDEANLAALGTSEFGNRTGYTVGGRFIGLPRQDIRIEYTKLRPFVYTHWYPINRPTTWDTPLATELPPNSDEWNFSWIYHPTNRIDIEIFGTKRRHGATPPNSDPVGGSATETRLGNEGTYPFLAGVRQSSEEIGVGFQWQALERLTARLRLATGQDESKAYNRFLFRFNYNFWAF